MATLRFTTAGESHGPGLVAIVEGLPAGLELDRERIDRDMARRQLGHGRGGRMKIESDSVEIRSGVRHGRTLGSPVAVLVANRDYANWEERMNPWPVDAEVEEVHTPRPGHADLAGPAEVRPLRRPQRARARERARDRGASGRRGARQGAPARLRRERPQPRDPDRLGARRRSATTSAPEDFAGRRRVAGPLPRPGGRRGDGRRDRPAAEGQREPRRDLRGAGLRARSRASARTSSWDERLDGAPRPGARLDPGREGRLGRRGVGGRRPAGLRVPRRDLLVGGARLAPRDQPRRRRRGRDDERRAAHRPRRAEADLDPDQAAALGRHRDQGAGRRRCASAPTRRSCRPPAWSARRWSRWSWRGATARSSAATTSTTRSRRYAAYRERIEWRR